jgi:hypothetical protein
MYVIHGYTSIQNCFTLTHGLSSASIGARDTKKVTPTKKFDANLEALHYNAALAFKTKDGKIN